MKAQHIQNLAAILPSTFVAIAHLTLSVRVAPYANVVFQRWFDTGEQPSGGDAVIASLDSLLSRPIPALLFAEHPVYGITRDWWIATIVNSTVWGLGMYVSYFGAAWLLKRFLDVLSRNGAAREAQ